MTVVDNILPTIVCPANITQQVDIVTSNKLITYIHPIGTYNCPNPTTIQTPGSLPLDDDNESDIELSNVENRSKSNGFTAYPNPLIDQLNIDFNISGDYRKVEFVLQDISGRQVRNLEVDVNGDKTIRWNLKGMQAGIYQIAMKADDLVIQRKLITIIK